MALDFIAGCIGGCAGVLVGHPLDTVKVKLQTQDGRNPLYRGTWDCFSKIVKKESVAGVYRGISSPMAGVAVVNALVFGVHGEMRRMQTDPNSLQSHFMAGAMAGLVQSVVASPVELLKSRVQTSPQYGSVVSCLVQTAQHEGMPGVFKGLTITAARECLGYGLYFATYEAMTRQQDPEAPPVSTATMLLAGGWSGVVSWVFTYPLDVIKTRIQTDNKYRGVLHCLTQSIREEGLGFLGRGLTPTLIRAFPTNAVTFTVVTWVFRLADASTEKTNELREQIYMLLENIQRNNFLLTNTYYEEILTKSNLQVSIKECRGGSDGDIQESKKVGNISLNEHLHTSKSCRDYSHIHDDHMLLLCE